MRRLLVTGGAGFIGVNFVRYWMARRPTERIVVLDALTYAGNLASLPNEGAQLRFVRGDICDQALVETLLREEQIDTIVHFAAESHVDRSILGPGAFIETNVVGTHRLLDAARSVWLRGGRDSSASRAAHRFHHVSTDEVYGSLGPDSPAFREDTPYAPNSPYSASKAGSDHLVRAYHHTYGLQVTTSNCSNNYGPFQYPEKLIPLMILNSLHGRPLPVYGDGLNVRDWLHVEDHCRGIECVLQKGRVGETYNIGGSSELTNLAVVNTLCGMLDALFESAPELAARFPEAGALKSGGTRSLINYVPDRPGHDRRYAIDGSKIRSELDFSCDRVFADGLKSTVQWYVDHAEWWRKLLSPKESSSTSEPRSSGLESE